MAVAEVLAVLEWDVGEEGRERLLVTNYNCDLLSTFTLSTTLFFIILIGGTVRRAVGILLVDIVI